MKILKTNLALILGCMIIGHYSLRGMEEQKEKQDILKTSVVVQLRYEYKPLEIEGEKLAKQGIFESINYLPPEITVNDVPYYVDKKGEKRVTPNNIWPALKIALNKDHVLLPDDIRDQMHKVSHMQRVAGTYPVRQNFDVRIFRKGSKPGNPPYRDLHFSGEYDTGFPLTDVEKGTMFALLYVGYKPWSEEEQKVREFFTKGTY
jgi:hypothetical protein